MWKSADLSFSYRWVIFLCVLLDTWVSVEMDLCCECVFFWCVSWLDVVGAGLSPEVTDTGLLALALAGCGAQLTSLSLRRV